MHMVSNLTPYIFALIFSLSSISKAFSISYFLEAIKSFGFKKKVTIIGYSVLLIELILSLNFSLKIYLGYSYAISFILFGLFNFMLINVLLQKKAVRCNCFSPSVKPTNIPLSVSRNFIFMILAFCAIKYTGFESIVTPRFYGLNILAGCMLVQLYREHRITQKLLKDEY